MSETKIKLIENSILQEGYYRIDHKSGLKIFVYPKPQYASTYAVFGTRYGSIDTIFKRSDKESFTEIPEGTAHFLEHKLFESEELDAFEQYAKTGASANAFTSFDKTCYLFSCTGHFKENFRILLDFVRHPYFTEETVRKEQGIIGQEIDMYKDSPDWECLFNLLSAMYHYHPVKIDIAGTKESISKISADMLFDCYNTFYNLSNMALAVAGNVRLNDVLAIVDELITPDDEVRVERVFKEEPKEIIKSYVEKKMPVTTPTFCYGFKESHEKPLRSTKEEVAMCLLLDIIGGQISPLYKELLDEELVNNNFFTEYFDGYNYAVPMFSGESKNPKLVAEKIDQRINELKNRLITEEEFETVRKKQFGKTVRAFSDIDTVANSLIASCFNNEELYEEFEIIKNMELSYVNEMLLKSFNKETAVLSVITNK